MRAGCDGLIHPVAGGAFLASGENKLPEAKAPADKGVEVNPGNEDVAAHDRAVEASLEEGRLQTGGHFLGKESDLALEVVAEPEVAVSFNALAGDAGDGLARGHSVIEASLAVPAFKVVAWGNPKGYDLYGSLHFLAWHDKYLS